MTKPARTGLLTASLVLVGASLVGCSGGAPTDASEDEFCTGYLSLASDLGTLVDATDEEALDSIKTWAEELEQVGTPEDIPDEARDGFELMIEELAALDGDDTTEDFQLLDNLSDAEAEASTAFEKYTTDACGAMQLDTPELPELQEIPTPSS